LGYVDPGAGDEREQPEWYFDYDPLTGEIIPHPSLTGDYKRKAEGTIADLGLNQLDVRFYRLDWTRRFTEDWFALSVDDRQAFVDFSTRMGVEYAGSTLMMVRQLMDECREE